VKQCAVAQTAVVTLPVPSLFNDVLCKRRPHEFDLLIGKLNPAGLDGLPSGVKRSDEDVHGVRIKDAGLYVIVEEVAHFAPSRVSEAMLPLLLGLGERLALFGAHIEWRWHLTWWGRRPTANVDQSARSQAQCRYDEVYSRLKFG
jgi:hypothetical protein